MDDASKRHVKGLYGRMGCEGTTAYMVGVEPREGEGGGWRVTMAVGTVPLVVLWVAQREYVQVDMCERAHLHVKG